jgi:leucyl-tRNA synthetase
MNLFQSTIKLLVEKNLGKKKINYRLKDWGISQDKDIGDVQFQ